MVHIRGICKLYEAWALAIFTLPHGLVAMEGKCGNRWDKERVAGKWMISVAVSDIQVLIILLNELSTEGIKRHLGGSTYTLFQIHTIISTTDKWEEIK